jgi:hypothetical protein
MQLFEATVDVAARFQMAAGAARYWRRRMIQILLRLASRSNFGGVDMHSLTRTIAAAFILSCVGGLTAKIPATDLSFAKAAAAEGIAEVQAAQAAEKKAMTPRVKEFAPQMDKDHTLANTQLIEIAKAEGITLPT